MLLNKICTMVFMLVMVCAVTGCNTMEGIGKDIQKAGETIEGAAK
jgi:predicted small secreted protein